MSTGLDFDFKEPTDADELPPDPEKFNWNPGDVTVAEGEEPGFFESIGLRFNPHHGADGKFSGGAGGLAGHAPATTATGSKIVVEEAEPKSAADRKQLAAAEAAGKTAIHIKDTPDIRVEKTDAGTTAHVGGNVSGTVTPGEGGKGWKYTPHDYDGAPLGEGDARTFRSRETAEKAARSDARKSQEYVSREVRLNTKDPEAVVARGASAHLYKYGEKSYVTPGGLQYGARDNTSPNWTTTYRVLKKPEAKD